MNDLEKGQEADFIRQLDALYAAKKAEIGQTNPAPESSKDVKRRGLESGWLC